VALAALTMLVGPIMAKGLDRLIDARLSKVAKAAAEESPTELAEGGAEARVLVIGFGRFGQILTQVLLAEGVPVTVIDKDVGQLRAATRFGFRIYYGDGTRLDVLRAAGIAKAELVCICVDDREAALKIVDIVHEEFAAVRTFVRAYDRLHAVELMNREVDFQIRETSESALAFGRAALEGLGLAPEAAAARAEDVRKRDIARLVLQQAGALPDGSWLGGAEPAEVRPEPLTAPVRPARALNAETRDLLGQDRKEAAERVLAKPVLHPADEADPDEEEAPHGPESEAELEAEGHGRDV
jgi:CPA2 family monovalent cation:H+ antiporter-2/glutathione-regulated potassium-efflux system protein KefB